MPQLNKITQIYAIILGFGGLCGMVYSVVKVQVTQEVLVKDHAELKQMVISHEDKNQISREKTALIFDRDSRNE